MIVLIGLMISWIIECMKQTSELVMTHWTNYLNFYVTLVSPFVECIEVEGTSLYVSRS